MCTFGQSGNYANFSELVEIGLCFLSKCFILVFLNSCSKSANQKVLSNTKFNTIVFTLNCNTLNVLCLTVNLACAEHSEALFSSMF